HIVLIVLIVVAVASMFAMLGNSSTYADFAQAATMDADEEVHVVGTLARSKPLIYNPEKDPNRFEFDLVDRKGVERHVVLLKSKPQDFERSQQIVVIGSFRNNAFVASSILMKCPSKYNDGQQEVANN
ncbi:MAG: cytochrome c maturation protein CcmE, partial [Bacteroidia bacterium]